MSWEDEEDPNWKEKPTTFHTPAVVNPLWDGEDKDDGGADGDSWDSEKPPKSADSPKAVVPGARTLTRRQLINEKEAAEREARLAREKELALLNDPEAQKKLKEKQKRDQEAAELGLTMDAFGGNGVQVSAREFKSDQLEKDNVDMAGGDASQLKKDFDSIRLANPLDGVKLKVQADYKSLGEKVADMVLKGEQEKLVVDFLTTLIERTTKRMKLDDVAALSRKLTAIQTEKQKAEKPAKKPAAKKGSLVSGKSALGSGAYNWADEGEFYDDHAL